MYGIDKLCDDIESMIGFRPNLFWRMCWKYISPVFLVAVVICAIISSERLSFHNYLFPDWATAMGWIFSLSSVSAVPILFVAFLLRDVYFKNGVNREPDSQPRPTFV